MSGHAQIRLVTYNVHRCQGSDRKISPYRIAEVIAAADADVVALQELDVNRTRSGRVDQAQLIAALLEMEFHFHAAWQTAEERFGNAVLSRLPMRLIHAAQLPGAPRGWRERRGAVWVSVQAGRHHIQVINTHLGLVRHERLTQINALLGPHWLGHPDCRSPRVLCGDFNTVPGTRVHGRCLEILRDAQQAFRLARPRRTYPTRLPVARLDHVFLSDEFTVRNVEVVRTPLTRRA